MICLCLYLSATLFPLFAAFGKGLLWLGQRFIESRPRKESDQSSLSVRRMYVTPGRYGCAEGKRRRVGGQTE